MASTLDRVRCAMSSRYEEERELGRGGTSIVYVARDIRHERVVALKVLRPERTESVSTEAFQRDDRITAPIIHPNVVRLPGSDEASGVLCRVTARGEPDLVHDLLEREQTSADEEPASLGLGAQGCGRGIHV